MRAISSGSLTHHTNGFANAVRRGRIGLVAASGTGLQQVVCLVDRLGEGISQAIGVGGRDLDERVGGLMMLAGQLEKAGFRIEGVARAACVQRGRLHDAWVGALLPGDV